MKIIRILLLALAMTVFAVNFWTVDTSVLWSEQNLWAGVRILLAFLLVLLLVGMVRKDMRQRKR